MSPAKAGSVLDRIPIGKVTEVVQAMDQDKLIERLPEMSASKLFEIPTGVLFDELPKVSAEQLAFEVEPTVDPSLPPPTAVQVSATLAIYTVPETGQLVWAKLVGSPAPATQTPVARVEATATPTGTPAAAGIATPVAPTPTPAVQAGGLSPIIPIATILLLLIGTSIGVAAFTLYQRQRTLALAGGVALGPGERPPYDEAAGVERQGVAAIPSQLVRALEALGARLSYLVEVVQGLLQDAVAKVRGWINRSS